MNGLVTSGDQYYLGSVGLHSTVGSMSDCSSRGRKFDSQLNYIFMETDHKIISAVIFSLLLTKEGQLSVTGESMCTCTG